MKVIKTSVRKHYVDNLRWLILLVLIPYHTAMAWNTWGEPNYIYFDKNRLISSIVVFFSPYFMPLLFLLAGISTRYALKQRTGKEYIRERTKRLLLPLAFGTIVLMPVMTYLGDKFNCSYNGGFFRHYGVFFTKFTDFTGADGGFSLGQFWFCLYLFVISAISIGVLALIKCKSEKQQKTLPFSAVVLLGLPLPIFSEILSIGGKSLAEYTYLFLIGYFVFSNESQLCVKDDIVNDFINSNYYLYNRVSKLKYVEFINLYNYLEGFAPFATQHKIKGEQYKNVLVILDNGKWNKYNFEYLFNPNHSKCNQNVLKRTQKLFYVCCTRAMENLCVYCSNPTVEMVDTSKKWFGKENCIDLNNLNLYL